MTGIIGGFMYENSAGSSSLSTILLVQNTKNFNLRSALLALGWDGTSVVTTNVVISPGTEITSANISTPAFDTGAALPVGSVVTVENRGYIVGKGAKGNTSASGAGLKAQMPISINNTGIIACGGEGGARGTIASSSYYNGVSTVHVKADGGGGGGGAGYGEGGAKNTASGGDTNANNGTKGQPGTLLYGGQGGFGGQNAYIGGNDGDRGGNIPSPYGYPAGNNAIEGYSLITWIAAGNIYGNQV